jgi:LuxR family transcriptional regulator, quorum-sensing system regulator SolR
MSDAFDALECATTADQLRLATKKFARDMGFEHFAYVLTVDAPSLKTQQYILSGYPVDWVERYMSRDYFKVDPVIKHSQESTLPLIWGDQHFWQGKSEEFWDEARAFGLQAGLSISVRELPAVTGVFSLARDKMLEVHGQDLAALIGRSHMFATLLNHAVARIELPKLLPAQGKLTARELECLRWTAEGKTAWEIGQILGITERTAVFHLNNVIRKLAVTNKIQAVVRAVALRLV